MSSSEIQYETVLDAQRKQQIKNEFQDFFTIIYGRALNDSSWQHQFIHSPYNDSPLFLALDRGRIVGSALMIGQKVRHKGEILDYYLFTTSGVLKEYRNKGVYAELLKLQKEHASTNGKKFIFAFPNDLAYPVLRLFGGFNDLVQTKLVTTTLNNIDFSDKGNSLLLDQDFSNWRFEHKDYCFSIVEDMLVITKEFNRQLDILAIYDAEAAELIETPLTPLNEELKVNTLIDWTIDHAPCEVISNVNAVYFPLDRSIAITEIKLNLLMSDLY
ncbi:hypothetical protein PA25_04000 [Pseudoalteromonas sp. A25]|uniref:GNAT family N-acetyltransferase n=1 Tax=Pseudoalteromonas sp. A25 TaxID=116092 RepID=UPI001260D78B|nr:GNAT family N-acetyltransferase [Pseudoalteromonas sp. A25]BBN80415.1 hypothetical protein PA25_04000 [Pseudoalteromonas sp. A25]